MGYAEPMSSRLASGVLAGFCLAGLACGGASHPRQGTRAREVCERLVGHSFELRYSLATLALDDHGYQRRKIEAALAEQRAQLQASPTFLSSCGELTEGELACMTDAKDWYTHEGCYRSTSAWAQELARAGESSARRAGQSPAVEAAPEPPCPALADPGTGTATLRGVVRTAKGGPEVAAVVSLELPDVESFLTTITDENGRYELEGISPGRYNVVISGDRRQVARRCVPLRGGDQQTLDLERNDALAEPNEIIELR